MMSSRGEIDVQIGDTSSQAFVWYYLRKSYSVILLRHMLYLSRRIFSHHEQLSGDAERHPHPKVNTH